MRKSSGVVYRASTARTSQAHAAEIGPLLAKLRSEEAQAGWEEFLLQYSPALYQTARTLARDEDDVADCFVHICEQLAKDRFGRLLRFKPDGAASFLTWLRVVARNLCHDWHRKKHGRARPFKILQNLPPLELETYRFRFERHLSQEETLQQLRGTWPSIEVNELIETERRIEERLNPAQRWILSVRNQALGTSMRANDEDELGMMEFADPAPSPESAVEDKEQRRALRKCVEALRAEDRLILRLRFDDELSLDEISQLAGLGDAQRVHRRLTSIGGVGAVHLFTAPLAASQFPNYLFQPPDLANSKQFEYGSGAGLVPGYPFLIIGEHLRDVGTTGGAGQVYVYKKY